MKRWKRFSAILLVLCLSLGLVSCTPPTVEQTSPSGGSSSQAPESIAAPAPADIELEAPTLATLVASGQLPPLAERLPDAADIMIEEMDSTGAYGDKFTFNFLGKKQQWKYGKATEEGLFRFRTDGTIEPNVAKGFDVNADSTEFTIYLRAGMKWSDGVPFTAEDCVFFYEKMCVPESFGRSLWDCFYSTNAETGESTPCTMEVVNETTFKVKFADPNPFFLEKTAINAKWLFAPKHYYETILPEFIGQTAAEAKAKEMGYSDVAAMGGETGYYYWNVVGRPTLRPWVVTNDVDSDLMIMKRNPYYWKTDADGRQLPYIDELHWVRIAELQQEVLNIMSGKVDLSVDLSYGDVVTLKENEDKGGYDITMWNNVAWSHAASAFQLNQTVKDADYRALFQNKSFRQALSIAADRKEIVTLVYDDFASPTQASPQEGSRGYDKEWASKWTEYDPASAKKLLEEECGLVMGSDGYYNFASGKDLFIEILTHNEDDDVPKVAELLTEKYFKAIGIKATFAVRDRSLIQELEKSNDLVAVLYPVAPMSTINIALRPDTLVPTRQYAVWYGSFGNWYASKGKDGLEPTGDILKLQQLYDQMLVAKTAQDAMEIGDQMLAIHKENIWQIGYASQPPTLLTVGKDIKNFPAESVFSDEYRDLGIAHLQNLYFSSDKQ